VVPECLPEEVDCVLNLTDLMKLVDEEKMVTVDLLDKVVEGAMVEKMIVNPSVVEEVAVVPQVLKTEKVVKVVKRAMQKMVLPATPQMEKVEEEEVERVEKVDLPGVVVEKVVLHMLLNQVQLLKDLVVVVELMVIQRVGILEVSK
jgi:hypothetical protein